MFRRMYNAQEMVNVPSGRGKEKFIVTRVIRQTAIYDVVEVIFYGYRPIPKLKREFKLGTNYEPRAMFYCSNVYIKSPTARYYINSYMENTNSDFRRRMKMDEMPFDMTITISHVEQMYGRLRSGSGRNYYSVTTEAHNWKYDHFKKKWIRYTFIDVKK